MESRSFQITWPFRLVNRWLDRIGAARWSGLQLDAARLLEVSQEKTGLSDFGEGHFREGLEVFVDSLIRDADLTPIGRAGLRGMIVTLLCNRLHIAEARRREAWRFEAAIRPPVVITGTPRSGTTFLHRLLAEDATFRTLPMWRLFKPVSRESEDSIRREVGRAHRLRRLMTPQLDRKHFLRADSPEECIWLLNNTFLSHGLWVAAPVYGYLEWLGTQDRSVPYREYASLLRYLQSGHPERTLLLKAPSHAGALAALDEVLPSPAVIQLHRDPVEVCSSVCSLFATLHGAVTRRLDLARLGRTTVDLLRQEALRNLEARRRLSRPPLDIRYPDLIRDPGGTVRRIYGHFDWPWDDALEERLRRHLELNPQGKHGAHRHDLEDFGISREEIARTFAPYRRMMRF
ncbi:MAG: sulfotransferase [Acidobacteriota bacterium]